MSIEQSALDVINWLKTAVVEVSGGALIKERYDFAAGWWVTRYRPDCAIQSAYAFLKAWQYTMNGEYLELSRQLFNGVTALQNEDGSFPYHTDSDIVYTNDNSEIAIYLLRMSDIDIANQNAYRTAALKITDWLIGIQNADGSWRRSSSTSNATACFTAHAIGALSQAYKYTNNKEQYRAAVELAINYISTKITDSGRITLMGANEAQRPPSSDQSIVIRGIAMAETHIPCLANRGFIVRTRKTLIKWLNTTVTEEGAVKNGIGDSTNGADTENITDFVYTIPFAIEAYYFSFCADGNIEHLNTALRIIRFSQTNIYYKDGAVSGVLRGAYNIANKNWDTTEAVLDSSQQGGGDMIYTGWTNAPVAAQLFSFAGVVRSLNLLSIYADNKAVRAVARETGEYKVRTGDKTISFPVVSESSGAAMPIKMRLGNQNKAFAYII